MIFQWIYLTELGLVWKHSQNKYKFWLRSYIEIVKLKVSLPRKWWSCTPAGARYIPEVILSSRKLYVIFDKLHIATIPIALIEQGTRSNQPFYGSDVMITTCMLHWVIHPTRVAQRNMRDLIQTPEQRHSRVRGQVMRLNFTAFHSLLLHS